MQRFMKIAIAVLVFFISARTMALAEDRIIFDGKVEHSEGSAGVETGSAGTELNDATRQCGHHAPELDKRDSSISEATQWAQTCIMSQNQMTQTLGFFGVNGYTDSTIFDDGIDLVFGGRFGTINRASPYFLRTELGGMVINPRHVLIRREDEEFRGFDFRDIKYGLIDPFGLFSNDELDWFFGVSYASSSARSFSDLFSANGNELGILSPAGPAGPSGGGFLIGAGFGDILDLGYNDSYSEYFVRTGVQNTFDLNVGSTKLALTPRIGFFYSSVDEESSLSGVTNGGTFPFRYDYDLEADRYGLELGLDLKYHMTPIAGVYLDGDARFIQNDASSTARLQAGAFAPELGRDSKTENDFGGRIGGGIFVENESMRGRIGLEYETWQIPLLHTPGTRESYLTFEDRESVAARLELVVKISPQLVAPAE